MKVFRVPAILAGVALLAAGAPTPPTTPPDESPVADAAERGDAEEVQSLLRDGADPNGAQPDGMTALHWAADRNDADIARLLLYAGATVKATTRVGGYTPLHLASRNGNAEVAAVLLERGADPNAFTDTGVTPLHFAAEADAGALIETLVAHGADPDARDTFAERTPLMFASARNAGSAARALLSAGADPSLTTRVKDWVAIWEANEAEQERRQRIREAAEAPEEDAENEEWATEPEKERSEEEAEKKAESEKVEAPEADPAEPSPAEEEEAEAEPWTHPDSAKAERMSLEEQVGKQGGFTALHYAAREGHRETARLLVEGGADVNQVTEGDHSSPMLVAIINGNYDLARDLLEAGADPNLVSEDGAGPLFATLNIEWSLRTWYPQPQAFRQQETSYLELMERLLQAGADPNQRVNSHIWYASYNAGRMGVDFIGATPFWRAAYAADVEAMRLLQRFGADPNIWTMNLPPRPRRVDPDIPNNPENERTEEKDYSGLPEVPVGGPAVHPLHAVAGVGFGTSRVAQQHRAVPGGVLPSVKYLIEEVGVDPNIRDMDGFTAVHHAAARGDNETIRYLVSQGADVTLLSRRGHTTADMANSPEQRAQPLPQTIALLEKLGSLNSHQCQSCGGATRRR